MKSSPVVYKDFWFKIIGCLMASYIVDALDRQETIFQRLSSKYFYTDLAGGFVIALILWELVRISVRYLDKKISWADQPFRRTVFQIALGVVSPAILSFVLTMLWMQIAYNQDIFKTSWLFNEFYTVILIILLINLVYFAWWLYLAWKHQSQSASEGVNGRIDQHLPVLKTIQVNKAGKTILLSQNDIAYSFLRDGYCYIKTFDADSFVTTYTLDELAKMLNNTYHFRVNRQILIAKKACKTYKSVEFGKIELELDPALKTPVIVSQKRAKDFRKWISADSTA